METFAYAVTGSADGTGIIGIWNFFPNLILYTCHKHRFSGIYTIRSVNALFEMEDFLINKKELDKLFDQAFDEYLEKCRKANQR